MEILTKNINWKYLPRNIKVRKCSLEKIGNEQLQFI